MSKTATYRDDQPPEDLSGWSGGASKPVLPAESDEISFTRPDWALFRNLGTLPQKTGVGLDLLRRLVVKELVDNAYDAGASIVSHGETQHGGYFVEDDGPGLEPEVVSTLYSIARPLISSKTLRLPRRGALGNGLRAVAGAVLASDGSLTVETRGRRLTLQPHHDGGTELICDEPCGTVRGTRVEIVLGKAVPPDRDADPFAWARLVELLANGGKQYAGRSSPWWYTTDDFHELLQAASGASVRDVVGKLDGCSGRASGSVARPYLQRTAASMARDQAADLLGRARAQAKEVGHRRLGRVGELPGFRWRVMRRGWFDLPAGTGTSARVPYVLEAWGSPAETDSLTVCVNRTPTTGEIGIWRTVEQRETWLVVQGNGIKHAIKTWRTAPRIAVLMNITVPTMPITNDGKQPDLDGVKDDLLEALRELSRKAKGSRPSGAGRETTQKEIVEALLESAVEKASGGGTHRYTVRQLFYVVRPALIEALGKEPDYEYFCQIVAARESIVGPLPGICRDPRGTLYVPHSGVEIPVGTLTVEGYEHPEWTINHLLYIEKEGFFDLLKSARWPERNDCALLTSKGQPTGAARDLLDRLGEVGEDIRFYCVHDADAAGTVIYQSLVDATRTRAARTVPVIDLGLDVFEAMEMDLEVEGIPRKARSRQLAVAQHIDPEVADWYQHSRVELNAMTSPQFLAWLDGKMADHGQGRLVPPDDVLRDRFNQTVEERVRRRLSEQILREAKLEKQVASRMSALQARLDEEGARLGSQVRRELDEEPARSWRDPVDRVADTVVDAELPESPGQSESSTCTRGRTPDDPGVELTG